MSWLRAGALDVALAGAWRAARPFPHVVIDDLISEQALEILRRAVSLEPHWQSRGDLFEVMVSGDALVQPELRAFLDELATDSSLAAVRAITGRPVTRVELRSYVYLVGGHLLPHTDAGPDAKRHVSLAFYLGSTGGTDGGFRGGELELFDCELDGDEVVATRPAALIEPRANRLVLFDVSVRSLHQVREVTSHGDGDGGGGRVSLAGWFL